MLIERLEQSATTLADVGLAGWELNFLAQLSDGQQEQVTIARALINKAEILLADKAHWCAGPRTPPRTRV